MHISKVEAPRIVWFMQLREIGGFLWPEVELLVFPSLQNAIIMKCPRLTTLPWALTRGSMSVKWEEGMSVKWEEVALCYCLVLGRPCCLWSNASPATALARTHTTTHGAVQEFHCNDADQSCAYVCPPTSWWEASQSPCDSNIAW